MREDGKVQDGSFRKQENILCYIAKQSSRLTFLVIGVEALQNFSFFWKQKLLSTFGGGLGSNLVLWGIKHLTKTPELSYIGNFIFKVNQGATLMNSSFILFRRHS